jgi:hypothetical protein
MSVIIVGGVAGGASCAARLRRRDEKAAILMVERGLPPSERFKVRNISVDMSSLGRHVVPFALRRGVARVSRGHRPGTPGIRVRAARWPASSCELHQHIPFNSACAVHPTREALAPMKPVESKADILSLTGGKFP